MSSFNNNVPGAIPEVIETQRLILLSPPRIEHDQAYVDMMNDSKSMEFLSAMSKAESGGYVMQDAVNRREYAAAAQASRNGWFCHILLKTARSSDVTQMSWKATELPGVTAGGGVLQHHKYDKVPPRKEGDLSLTKICSIPGATGLALECAEFVGVTGFRAIDWNNLQAEIGIILCSKHFKSGICTEALYAVLLVGFEVLKLNRLTFITTVTNTGMNHFLQEVIGVSLEGVLREFFLNTWKTTDDGSTDANSYAVLASEWPMVKERLELRLLRTADS